jgi:hypothetical protein
VPVPPLPAAGDVPPLPALEPALPPVPPESSSSLPQATNSPAQPVKQKIKPNLEIFMGVP